MTVPSASDVDLPLLFACVMQRKQFGLELPSLAALIS
jgi:hypothetical protein